MQVPSPAAPGRLRTDGRKAPQPGHADTPALRVGEHVRAGGEGPDVGPGEGTGTRGQERARSALQRAVGVAARGEQSPRAGGSWTVGRRPGHTRPVRGAHARCGGASRGTAARGAPPGLQPRLLDSGDDNRRGQQD